MGEHPARTASLLCSLQQAGQPAPHGGKVLGGEERVYGQYEFNHFSITATASNCKTSPSGEYFSVERNLASINCPATVSKQKPYRTPLHDMAMEGSPAQSFFNFITMYTKYVSASLHSRPPTKLIL